MTSTKYQELYTQCIEKINVLDFSNSKYGNFLKVCADRILLTQELYELNASGKYRNLSLKELEEWNTKLYSPVYEENYKTCYANPEYAVSEFGQDGKLLAYLYKEILDSAETACGKRLYALANLFDLYLKVYNVLVKDFTSDELKKIFYNHRIETLKDACYFTVGQRFDPSYSLYTDLIKNQDLTDLRYLYFYGKHITDNEVKIAQFLNSLSEEEIKSMASTFTEGFLIGYKKLGKDIHTKKSVAVYYAIGFERMERYIFENMAKEGIVCQAYSMAISTTEANRQYNYDYKDSMAIYLDENFVEKYLACQKEAYEAFKVHTNGFAGPLALETFGEKEFNPQNKKDALHYSDEQQKLYVKLSSGLSMLMTQYVIMEERSFSIIAYPIPEIGEKFQKVFAETVKVNTLDYKTYEDIQQKLIDALDQADHVTVKGLGNNKTDLSIKIWDLKNPSKESAFENCVADVNIPVGEVFTSPVLKGTNGMLNVSKVYLNGMMVKDLEIVLKDGMIESYTCGNFDTEKENAEYLDDIVMFHHKSLPIGEFAIGTNTTAYKMGIELDCQDKLPILIAEKTGPHFAMGDTCYSHSEEIATFNPDGKEIIARDNEVSVLRKTDASKAYFNCHTDITIPYNELDSITAVRKDGTEIQIIKGGRFVLEGTQELNKPLIELYGC